MSTELAALSTDGMVSDHKMADGGVQRLYRFGNDYGASVILSPFSYGVELAVTHWVGQSFSLVYNTPVTHDVVGHLTLERLLELLGQIEALPRRSAEDIAADLRGETPMPDDDDDEGELPAVIQGQVLPPGEGV